MSKKSRRKEQLEEKAWTLTSIDADFLALMGAGATIASGDVIGAGSAMRVPAVAAAVRTIAETVASLPIHVFKRADDGGRERERDHPAAKVLERPAPWCDSFTFKQRLVMDAILHGRGVAVAARGAGEVRELHRVRPGVLRIDHNELTGEPSYVLNPTTGGERRYKWEDVVEIVPVPGEGTPISLISLAAEAIGFAAILQRHGTKLFANGARPSGLLSFKGKLTAEQIKQRIAIWNAAHGGGKTGGTAALDQEAGYTALTLNSVDAQFLELWRFVILEIARVFRLPPHMLGELERATHSNSEEMGLQFITYSLRPWLDMIVGALSRVLLTKEERATHSLEFQMDDLTRGNIAARFAALHTAIGGPFLTPNEGRAIENRPAIEGKDTLNEPQGTANPTAAPGDVVDEPGSNLRIVA